MCIRGSRSSHHVQVQFTWSSCLLGLFQQFGVEVTGHNSFLLVLICLFAIEILISSEKKLKCFTFTHFLPITQHYKLRTAWKCLYNQSSHYYYMENMECSIMEVCTSFINLKVGVSLDHGISLCFALLLLVLWTCWATFQAKRMT